MFLLNLIQVTWKETSESNKFIGFFEEGHQAKRMFHCKEQKCIILLSATHKLCYFCDGHSHCTFACHLQHPKECHQCFYSTIKTYNFYLFFTHTNIHTHTHIWRYQIYVLVNRLQYKDNSILWRVSPLPLDFSLLLYVCIFLSNTLIQMHCYKSIYFYVFFLSISKIILLFLCICKVIFIIVI